MSEQVLDVNAEVTSSEDAIFDDIRPCRDDEVHHELTVIQNDESLVNGDTKLLITHNLQHTKTQCFPSGMKILLLILDTIADL